MATDINQKELENYIKQINEYIKALGDLQKLQKDQKTIDAINTYIQKTKELTKELKDNTNETKRSAKAKMKAAEEAKKEYEGAVEAAKNATDADREAKNAAVDAAKAKYDEAQKGASAAKQAVQNIWDIQDATLKLQKVRAAASKDLMALFDVWKKGSDEAMGVVKELYDDLATSPSIKKRDKDKKEIEDKIELLKKNKELNDSQKDELIILRDKLNLITAEEKAEANRRKEFENYVKTVNSGVKMSMTIVKNLMKFTPLGSTAEVRKPKKETDTPNAEKTDNAVTPITDNALVTDVPTAALTPESATPDSATPATPTPAPGSEGGEDGEENMTEDQKTANFKKNQTERIDSAIEYAEAASEIAGQLNSFLDDIDAQRMQKVQAQYDEDLAALNEELASKQISEEEYNTKKSALDNQLDKDKAKIEREQAIRKKAMGIFQVGIDMAVGIMKSWVDVPVWLSVVYTAAIASMGAVQIAAIAASPLPKARKGGLIVGSSHENGGVLIEAEGGEAILSREAMEAFPGMAQLMNAAAGGYIYDGGYAARSVLRTATDDFASADGNTVSIDYNKLAAAITESLKEMKIFVAVTDINDGLKQYVQLDEMAKL